MESIYINTDGGSRGNPGPAAIGVVFFDQEGNVLYKYKDCIGRATNNEAEYRAIICALKILKKSKWLLANGSKNKSAACRLDSQLVVEQINGNYKIKQDHIGRFVQEIRDLISQMAVSFSFTHIPREENKLADKLVNEALDEEKKQNEDRSKSHC